MTRPSNPAGDQQTDRSAPNGSAVPNGSTGAHAATAPWPVPAHGATADPGEATATTTSLPTIGGPNDPYAGGHGVAASTAPARPTAAAAPAPVAPSVPPASRMQPPPRPATAPPLPNAVDQYAALRSANPGGGDAVTTANPLPYAGAAGVGAVAGAAGATAPPAGVVPPPVKVRPAKPIRSPKAAGRARSPRRAKLQLRHLNVWSVLRFSCVLALALFFVWLIMVGFLYGILDITGVFDKVNETVRTINGDDNAKDVITPGIVFGGAFVIGLVNIVLFIALSTIGSVVYNLCADLVGGVEVTLAEHE